MNTVATRPQLHLIVLTAMAKYAIIIFTMVELFRRTWEGIIPPPPSQELREYVNGIFDGVNTDVPTFGQGRKGIFDYYGKDEEGSEMARFRIPWGAAKELERSFHIERTTQGTFKVTDEGFYPAQK